MRDRKYHRVKITFPIRVTTDNLCYEDTAGNLSLSGLSTQTALTLPVGDSVTLSINLATISRSTPLTIKAIVVRSDGHRTAFQFKEMDVDTFALLSLVIKGKSRYLKNEEVEDFPDHIEMFDDEEEP